MPWSWVGAQQGLGTVSGLIKCTCGYRKHKSDLTESAGCRESACHLGLFGTYQSLHNSMIGGIHVRVQRESTFSFAVVCCISLWCNDPVLKSKTTYRCQFCKNAMKCEIKFNVSFVLYLPSQISETDIQLMFFTAVF